MSANGELLTPVEAAEFLGRSAAYLANMRTYRTGPKFVRVKRGRQVLIRYKIADLKVYKERAP